MAINQVIDGTDRVTEYSNRWKLNQVAGTFDTYDIEQVTGEIVNVGTPYSAEILNKIDNVLSYLTPNVGSTEIIPFEEIIYNYNTINNYNPPLIYNSTLTLPYNLLNITKDDGYSNLLKLESWYNYSASGFTGTVLADLFKPNSINGIAVGRYSSSRDGYFELTINFEKEIQLKSLTLALFVANTDSYGATGYIDLYNNSTKIRTCTLFKAITGTYYQDFILDDYTTINKVHLNLTCSRSASTAAAFNVAFTDFKIQNNLSVSNLVLDNVDTNSLKNNQIIKFKGDGTWNNGYSLNGVVFDKLINSNEYYELTYNQSENKFITNDLINKIINNYKITTGNFAYVTSGTTIDVILNYTPDMVIIYDKLNNNYNVNSSISNSTFRYIPKVLTKNNIPYLSTDGDYGGEIIENGFKYRTINTGSINMYYYIALKIGG